MEGFCHTDEHIVFITDKHMVFITVVSISYILCCAVSVFNIIIFPPT